MNWRSLLRLVWASPCSLVGLALAAFVLSLGGRARLASGILEVTLRRSEATSPWLTRRFPFRAIALGHVVVAVGRQELDRIRAHELVHVRQYERWGPAFFVAYLSSSLWQLLNGRSAYWHNHFEIEARLLSGGRR